MSGVRHSVNIYVSDIWNLEDHKVVIKFGYRLAMNNHIKCGFTVIYTMTFVSIYGVKNYRQKKNVIN